MSSAQSTHDRPPCACGLIVLLVLWAVVIAKIHSTPKVPQPDEAAKPALGNAAPP